MDMRNIKNGYIIHHDGYSDQPYVVKTDDNHWLMCLTVGGLEEGSKGQHVVSLRSDDKGKTWKDTVDVESPEAPESSYSVLYKTKYGRIYCFYNFNADNLCGVIGSLPDYPDGICTRVDTQGHFVFKYSDDNGLSWSEKWYDIPQRDFEVDRLNPYGGKIKYFWNVGKPLEIQDRVLVPLYKIREFGLTFMEHSEGVLLECDNINTERDPEKLNWKTLPDGEIGIRAPKEASIISEEHSFVRLSDGTVFCVFRTVSGHPYCAYSYDDCHTFTEPVPMTYANGRVFKHPRAANFIWKCENGKYLYWFHNHGGKSYDGRNPVFLCGAWEVEKNGRRALEFGNPKIVLYDDDPKIRMSYPDLIEDDGEYYLTETQKEIARVHHVDKELIESLWQEKEFDGWQDSPCFDANAESFSIRFETGEKIGEILRDGDFEVTRCENGNIVIKAGENEFINDDVLLEDMKNHTVTAVFDRGTKVVCFTTDGIFCDGGEKRQFGFTRFSSDFTIDSDFKKSDAKIKFAQGLHLYN